MTALNKRLLFPFVALLLLAACIEINDFGKYWDKGVVDATLAGSWRAVDEPGDSCVYFIANGNTSRFISDLEEFEVRTLPLGAHAFLMMREKGARGGQLLKYTVTKDRWTLYELNRDKKEEFMRDHPNSGIAIDEYTARVEMLDEKAAALIQEMAGRDYWKASTQYERAECDTPDVRR